MKKNQSLMRKVNHLSKSYSSLVFVWRHSKLLTLGQEFGCLQSNIICSKFWEKDDFERGFLLEYTKRKKQTSVQ